MGADLHILSSQKTGSWAFVYGVCVAIVLCGIAVFSWVIPYFAKFDNTVRQTFSNGWRLAATHLLQTAGMLAINCLPVIWLIVSPRTFASVFWIWFFCGEGASAYLCSLMLNPVFDRLMPEE